MNGTNTQHGRMFKSYEALYETIKELRASLKAVTAAAAQDKAALDYLQDLEPNGHSVTVRGHVPKDVGDSIIKTLHIEGVTFHWDGQQLKARANSLRLAVTGALTALLAVTTARHIDAELNKPKS